MTCAPPSDRAQAPPLSTRATTGVTPPVGHQRLVIVVPAWKPRYLEAALDSIARQTDKRFDCHIYDDAGPEEVAAIARRFPQFHYQRFSSNLGGHALVEHWNRCLQHLPHEWVWLFSDDDVMAPGSVASVLAAIERQPTVSVLQLAVRMCSSDLQAVTLQSDPPAWESADDFLAARLSSERLSCLPDHVFNWTRLRELAGGMVVLPLAWNADDATWLLLAGDKGLSAAPGAMVLWRQSDTNISAQRGNVWTKLGADVAYVDFLHRHGFMTRVRQGAVTRWFSERLVNLYGFDFLDLPMLWRRLPWPLRTAWFLLMARLCWRRLRRGRRAAALARSEGG